MTLTTQEYKKLDAAFEFFNMRLFKGELPPCLITLNRKRNAKGYFFGGMFVSRLASKKVDEIALNPETFEDRTDKDILSTLAHEMVHLQQHHFGKPSRNAYHNRQWADWMEEIGLMPTDTGKEGGKRTGQRVTHYIIEGGLFDLACDVWLKGEDVQIGFNSLRGGSSKSNSNSKVKYTCPECGQNCWAKPNAILKCGICDDFMEIAP
jgi:predicted SprT family Zn-dependent metalloprotease